jgi:iron complex outermembrane receptor protein
MGWPPHAFLFLSGRPPHMARPACLYCTSTMSISRSFHRRTAAWPRRAGFHPLALAAAGLFSVPALAQEPPAETVAAPAERIVVTGNPLGREGIAQPSQSLAGDRLTLQRAATLGQTLDGLPGVASSWFGPNANRPAIRGLDGDRVRLLDNAGASIDASNLSFDHAVALDPLVVERIEVLRGPASLLYGGNATGGVVNTIDNRIPREPVDAFGGRAELRFGGASDERAASALVEGGAGGFSWHADGFTRQSADLRVPRFTPIEDGEAGEPTRRVRNSAAEGEGGAVGASWADADGYAGLSLDTYRNRYGVTVEPDVTIRMQRDRLALAAERKIDLAGLTNFSLRASDTRYEHQEVEGSGEVGTTFSSRGQDLRLELRHAPLLGGVQGVFGLQAESMRFSALGEEAFVPDTRTRSAAVFALEEGAWAGWTLGAGARIETVSVQSKGDPADADEPRFGDAQTRRFTPGSLSLSVRRPLQAGWVVSGMLARTERAPAYYELFANGVHVATAAYERGDPSLGVERGTHVDLGLQWQSAGSSVKAHVYQMHFDRFISLDATGEDIEVPNEDGGVSLVPEYRFQAVPARLWGAELEGRHRLWDGGWSLDGHASLDLTRGTNRDTGEPLPRLAPMRATIGLEASMGAWRGGVEWRHAWAQTRVPATDKATSAYSLVNLWASHSWAWGGLDGLVFLRLDNLGNTLAYSATAIGSVRELSPLPGRSATGGVRVSF